jgi:hypothetical protein
MDGENLADLFDQTHDAARIFLRVAQEIDDLTERLEHRTKDTPAWYGGTRARVEARATLEQAEELRCVLEELGERLGG